MYCPFKLLKEGEIMALIALILAIISIVLNVTTIAIKEKLNNSPDLRIVIATLAVNGITLVLLLLKLLKR